MSNKKETALKIINKLISSGFESYLAGGCVRDEIMGIEAKDYDIATAATPDQIKHLFKKVLDVGEQFGVSMIIEDNNNFEVTTFRKEYNYKDGRHPSSVSFGALEDDYKRRDLTINAIYKDTVKNKFIDFSGGIEDIKRHVIRCVGDPEERFREDHLRIMRVIRFSSRFNYTIEPATLAGIKKYSRYITNVSAERIRDELLNILKSQNADKGLQLMFDTGILKQILPEVEKMKNIKQPPEFHPEGDVFDHTLLMFKLAEKPDDILAMSILLHDVGKPVTMTVSDRIRFNLHHKAGSEIADAICRRLKFSNKDREKIVYIIYNHMKFMEARKMREGKLRKMIYSDTFETELELNRIDCLASHGNLDSYEFLLDKMKEFEKEDSMPAPIISGNDLISLGLNPGPVFKDIIDELYLLQLENKIKNKSDAIKIIKKKWGDKIEN